VLHAETIDKAMAHFGNDVIIANNEHYVNRMKEVSEKAHRMKAQLDVFRKYEWAKDWMEANERFKGRYLTENYELNKKVHPHMEKRYHELCKLR